MIWPNFYDLLGVGLDADALQLQAARAEALAALPRSFVGRATAALRGRSTFRIERASRVLGDPARRARYDLDLWIQTVMREAPFH